MIIKELIIKNLAQAALNSVKERLRGFGATWHDDAAALEAALGAHLESVESWSAEVSFADARRARPIEDIFIDLQLFVQPLRLRLTESENVETTSLLDAVERSTRHVVILGHPGAGKTTSVKYLTQRMLNDETFAPGYSMPMVVRLRDLARASAPTAGLIDYLSAQLGPPIRFPESRPVSPERAAVVQLDALVAVLSTVKPLVLLDGFDELPTNLRELVRRDVQTLSERLASSRIVLTSRTGEFAYNFPGFDHYELSPLTTAQLKQFVRRWLRSAEETDRFLEKLNASPFKDTALRPLTIAHLCAIYERLHDIPDKPKTVYRKVVNLLLEEWDQQQGLRRTSRYAHFETDRKFDFLSDVAYNVSAILQQTEFTTGNLLGIYRAIHTVHDLPEDEASAVAAELETHTGLLVQSGYEQFTFAHRSIQEYLAGEYVVRLPELPQPQLVLKIPNEMAVAVAVSSNPTVYLCYLSVAVLENYADERFLRTFIGRLSSEKVDFNRSDQRIFEACVRMGAASIRRILSSELANYRPTELEESRDNAHFVAGFNRLLALTATESAVRQLLSGASVSQSYRLHTSATDVFEVEHYRPSPMFAQIGPKTLYLPAPVLERFAPSAMHPFGR